MDEWMKAALNKVSRMKEEDKVVRELATTSLYFFAQLVNPYHLYGEIHEEVYEWLQEYSLFGQSFFTGFRKRYEDDLPASKMIMLPRGHLKSHMVATWCAWMITRHPEVTILYLSATSNLAEKQLYSIKNILESPVYRKYFPEYLCPTTTGRSQWTNNSVMIDHPKRNELNIRDATITIAGLTTNTTGWHADIIAADDIVVPENAYTQEGRESVSRKVSQFSSIRNPGGFTLAAGTRYHPRDEYANWGGQTFEVYDDNSELLDTLPVWEIKEYAVEEDGRFLWPRVVAKDGKAYGFNANILSKIKAEYKGDIVQFSSQYYNNPNAANGTQIGADCFQYYDPRWLSLGPDGWEFKGRRLNTYAAVDFAYTVGRKSDYTAIVVVGIDHDENIYVLDIDRFKADNVKTYYDHVVILHNKWEFKKLRAEVSVAQKVIVNDIKNEIRKHGQVISVEEFRPSSKEGSKRQRMAAILEPRYLNYKMWHRKDGNTPILEDELLSSNPANDDVMDALSSAIEIAKKPMRQYDVGQTSQPLPIHSRFGGVSFRG